MSPSIETPISQHIWETRYRYERVGDPESGIDDTWRRVAVARSRITEPEIVLLDEPTSALDVSVQAEVLNLLTRLQRERGLTYVLVSHNLAVVGHMCGGLAVMQHGKVVETMTVEQLRDNTPTRAYTKQLLRASLGYDRSALDELDETPA